ncbi:MAG: S-layer homology domain-containing protein [Candidatus Peribacter sp.]|nr:S-layer homology domain-containing protein [Candidatus Peribacter sp.]MBT4392975.1 S-layer homology domain-containing protein [Candidatus Peribacter sp.]MBT4601035.1 S-layer homology domain-containing protein [Candidatus Peribacter sp.]MBT5149603.1 S-layer homology domain-containing protein [Candidatus Peribacter sp.]MBT5637477.1 S-layer homology domain-containing protein [Candidatus Peribacter sp.]
MYHRSIPSLKSLVSVAGISLMLVSTTAHARFFDVSPEHPYFDAIEFLTREGIVEGYQNRSFQAERNINRAEFTKILVNVLYPQSYIDDCIENLPEPEEGEEEDMVIPAFDFPDVPHDSWFAPYICTAWTNAIVSGYPDGLFRPEEGVKFVESAKMTSIGFGLTGLELPNFGTANVLWYQPYVEFLAAQNAIPYSIIDLPQNLNRGEMAELIYRLKDYPIRLGPAPQKSKTAEDVIYPVNLKEYENFEKLFAFAYPNIWPDPQMLARGSYDGRSPYIASEWTMYFGPESDICIAGHECVHRDMWIDGYRVEDSEVIVDSIIEDQYFIEVESETIINGMPTLVVIEEVDKCIDKRAFYFGEEWIYALNIRCAGQDDKLFNFFDQIAQSVRQIEARPPEHRK